ncbi:MAG: hypothetical protein QOD57_5484, partial [Actinomycetota bacterium]|nr:hypothetical protein [Actinomycetota bacterium]
MPFSSRQRRRSAEEGSQLTCDTFRCFLRKKVATVGDCLAPHVVRVALP